MKEYKNISGKVINVCCKQRNIDEIFEADNKLQEIKNLVFNKYIEEVK